MADKKRRTICRECGEPKGPMHACRSVHDALNAEARASCALDGEAQHCIVCERKMHEHTCGKRPMTEAERCVVDAACAFVAARAHMRGGSPEAVALAIAVSVMRAEKEWMWEAKKGKAKR